MIEGLRDLYPYQAECFADAYCHLAVLSKLPIAEKVSRNSWEGPPVMVVRLGGRARDLIVIGAHTIRFPHTRAQFRQVRALSRFIETMPGAKIVMGDFNATPFSRVTRTVEEETGLVRLTALPTWPAWVELPQVAIDHIFASLLGPDTKTRFRPHYFGYTEPSFEVDLTATHLPKVKKPWIEIGGCGMVDPHVFDDVGYDSTVWSGYAFGMGLERLAMNLYGIDDIRYFYQNDGRFLKQFA